MQHVVPLNKLRWWISQQAGAFSWLIDNWLAESQLRTLGLHHQIPLGIYLESFCAWKCHPDGLGVTPRRHHKVVFQLSLVAVIDQVNARVNLPIADLGIGGNVAPPLRRIVAEEVVALAGQFFDPGDLPCRPRPNRLHTENGILRLWILSSQERVEFAAGAGGSTERQHRLVGGQIHRVSAAPRKKLRAPTGLTL